MAKSSEKVPARTGQGRAGVLESMWPPLGTLHSEIDRLFEEFGDGWPLGRMRSGRFADAFRGTPFAAGAAMPFVDVVDKEKELLVKAELPGMNEDEIEVNLSDTTLTISGEKKEEHQEGEEKGNRFVSERLYGSFQRSFPIPEGIDREKITAHFDKGVLTLTLPKKPEAQKKVKKIKVKAKK